MIALIDIIETAFDLVHFVDGPTGWANHFGNFLKRCAEAFAPQDELEARPIFSGVQALVSDAAARQDEAFFLVEADGRRADVEFGGKLRDGEGFFFDRTAFYGNIKLKVKFNFLQKMSRKFCKSILKNFFT